MLSCSAVSDVFVTLWTVAHQAPLSVRCPGKKTGVGCPFLLEGIFPIRGSNPHLPRHLVSIVADRCLATEPLEKPSALDLKLFKASDPIMSRWGYRLGWESGHDTAFYAIH